VKPKTLIRFDPKTEIFQTWMIPMIGSVVRHMMHFTDGRIVLTESGESAVALVTVRSGDKIAMNSK
jgi:virginiamycin B lyase